MSRDKHIVISIQPKWCELIASGKKTVEVRKTKPKLETPFKVYIYETQGRTETPFIDEEGHHIFKGRGQVIGEFVCDKIVEFENSWYDPAFAETSDLSCVGFEELAIYVGKKDFGFGWHITDLVIYDKPRELSEFRLPCDHSNDCCTCKRAIYCSSTRQFCRCDLEDGLKRPPQSWCYVESEDTE